VTDFAKVFGGFQYESIIIIIVCTKLCYFKRAVATMPFLVAIFIQLHQRILIFLLVYFLVVVYISLRIMVLFGVKSMTNYYKIKVFIVLELMEMTFILG
jgi:hypothetical protein